MFKSKKKQLDILKLVGVSHRDADRIVGGLTRLEAECPVWPTFFKKALKLAENSNEKNLIWYTLGVRTGLLAEHGVVMIGPPIKKMILDKMDERPEIQ